MKTNKILAFALGALVAVSCADFEEMNHNPKAIGTQDAKPYWALNKSIINDQQDPDIAERVFIYFWAQIARQDGESTNRACGQPYDEGAGRLYNLTKGCITSATNAIKLADELCQNPNIIAHEKAFFPNVKQFSRIWRVYLMSEYVDTFGPYTTDFESTSPKYESLADCYGFMFNELSEAIKAIDVNVAPESDDEKNCDPIFKFDAAKWKNYGISMWMRLAMRLSEVDETTAKTQFLAAVAAGEGIRTVDGTARVQERSGWDALSGVMSRTWDWQELSATMANLTTNLGGTTAEAALTAARLYKEKPDVEKVYKPYIKDADGYLGVKLVGKDKDGNVGTLVSECTDNPTQAYFFDGIPSFIDPRAFVYFCLPGDYDNRIETGYNPFMRANQMVDGKKTGSWTDNIHLSNNEEDKTVIDGTYAFNGLPCGWGNDQIRKANFALTQGDSRNENADYGITYPSLQERYRNTKGTEYRVFFGPWETYFLLAEASVRGWGVSESDADSYYNGIKASFDYLGLESSLYDSYITGTRYNRVGTSVKYDHLTEPTAIQDIKIRVPDGTGAIKEEKMTYNYPDPTKILYKGKKLNDKMTKIITQKYIANTPWLPLENWSDHRRLGLPFWEMPVWSEGYTYSYLDGFDGNSFKNGQKPGYYTQRVSYYSGFKNANPEEYNHAVQLVGLSDEGSTAGVKPLWWAIQQ